MSLAKERSCRAVSKGVLSALVFISLPLHAMRMNSLPGGSWKRLSSVAELRAKETPMTTSHSGAIPGSQTPSCRTLSGADYKQCIHDQVAAQTAANRAARDADIRKQQGDAAPSDAPVPPGTPSAGDSDTPRGGFSTKAAILTSAPGRPVVTYNNGTALLTIVTHSGYNGREVRYTTPLNRVCFGGDNTLTYGKACSQFVVNNRMAAEPLFRQSCDEGDPAACTMLGTYYLSSEKNWQQALALYQTACGDGEADACEEMAEAHRIGHGVPKDSAQTRTFYDRACALGNRYSCLWMQGKIDAECPHGFRSYRVDFNKNTYKVACVVPVPGNTFAKTEYELTPSAAELADMKSYGAYMRDHKATPIGEVVRGLLTSPGSKQNANCANNDIKGSDGNPISGSGCAGQDFY